MEVSDDELYRLYLDGNTKAYDELMIRYGDNLTCYLKGLLSSIEDAEDIMIEAFSRIMVDKPKIKPGNFKAYLFTVGRNLVARFYKKEKRVQVFSLEELSEDDGPESECFEETLFADEKKKALHRCIDRLEQDIREAVWLVYFENLSYDQAAKIMKVGKRKVEYMLARAKLLLKKELENEGYTSL